jgi:threonine dehydrogenase-like Zn-dependent dehydrogenase
MKYVRVPNSGVVPVGSTSRADSGLFDECGFALAAGPVDTAAGLLVGTTGRRREVLVLGVGGVGLLVVVGTVILALGTICLSVCLFRFV